MILGGRLNENAKQKMANLATNLMRRLRQGLPKCDRNIAPSTNLLECARQSEAGLSSQVDPPQDPNTIDHLRILVSFVYSPLKVLSSMGLCYLQALH